MKKTLKALLIFFSLFLLLIAYRLFYPLDREGKNKTIDVLSGKTFYQLAGDLEKKDVIHSARDLKLLVWIWGRPHLPKGEYELSSKMSLWKIFWTLKEGKEKTFLINFPEGFNHYEMGELLKNHGWPASSDFVEKVWDKAFVKELLDQDFPSLEGYLFPDSYSLRKQMSAEELIRQMVKNFKRVYKRTYKGFYNQFSSLPRDLSLNPHQIVTLASLIEKETGQGFERPRIAGVFYNRLKLKMKLQTDPTVLYAMYLQRGFGIYKNIRKKDLLLKSPYNTYVISGLPPGPIANPGEKSLESSFAPEKSSYLYFVSKNDGTHHFSKTYKEHQKAVDKYQIQAFKKTKPQN